MMRRRRPLMRGAMVGGVGYMAGKAGANRSAQESSQEQRLAELESQQQQAPSAPPPAAAPAAAAPAGGSVIEQLKQLGELRDSGVLTPEEFESQKQKILAAG
ncbi:MAG: SHOCT domain-containing protein [Solirubrobacteraceae bacterium]